MKEILHYYKALLFLPVVLFLSYSGHAQEETLDFKIQILEPDTISMNPLQIENVWGVYVKPDSGFEDGSNGTVTASGQITILVNSDATGDNGINAIHSIESVNGTWDGDDDYDVLRNPEGNDVSYYFIGLVDEGDGIPLENGEETLLLTFKFSEGCPESLALIVNKVDPLDAFGRGEPATINPGIDLAVFNTNTGGIHNWRENYQLAAWDCDDCDMDGILNGIEDTNGNGVYDEGIDASHLCDACDPLGIGNFTAELTGGDTLSVCSEVDFGQPDSAQLVVTTTGGPEPFIVKLNTLDAIGPDSIMFENYRSGDTLRVAPLRTTTYTLRSIEDSLGCFLTDPNAFMGSVTVSVEGPLGWGTGGNIPEDHISCTLDTLFFKVDATNGGDADILYQWQVSTDTGMNFADIANGTPYSLADTDSLVISNPNGLNGFLYRAKIFTETCDTLFSEPASLTVDGPFVINSSPVDAAICGIDGHEFIADTENLGSGNIVKQWQVGDGAGNWTNISDTTQYGDFNTDTLQILNPSMDISSLDSAWYRLQITGANMACEEVFTDSARLRVEGPLVITSFPRDTTACVGTSACFGVIVDNPGSGNLEYQWFARAPTAGSPWTLLSNDFNVSGVRSDTMCIANTEDFNGYEFRVDIGSTECAMISSTDGSGMPVTLTVNEAITFDANPSSQSVCSVDSETFFTVNIDSDDAATVGAWQVSRDSGDTWYNLSETNPIYTNVATAGTDDQTLTVSLSATTMPDTLNGKLYRVLVSGEHCEEVFSREAELIVHDLSDMTALTNPRDTTVCSGEPAIFEVDVPGYNRDTSELRFRWQILNTFADPDVWVNMNDVGDYNGVFTPRLSISDVNGFNGLSFRVGIFTNRCDTIFSDSATLTVEGPFVFGNDDDGHPQDTTICAGGTVTFTATPILDDTSVDPFGLGNINVGDSSSIKYNWVFNPLGDYTNPQDVRDLLTTIGTPGRTDTTSLTISMTTNELDGYAFWLELSSDTCQNVTRSLPAIVRVDGPLDFVVEPTDQTNCSDQGVIFGADVVNNGFGGERTIDYQWMEWDSLANAPDTDPTSTASIWTNITNDSIYNGATSDSLSISDLSNKNGNRYRLVATIDGCASISSEIVRLGAEGPIVVNKDPLDIITCVGQPGGFGAVVVDSTSLPMAEGTSSSNLSLNWQVSTNRGIDYSNLTDTPDLYSGVTTDTMSIDNIEASMHGYRYRLAITNQSGSCDTVFSLPARIRAEGPILFNAVRDTTICDNLGAEIEATIDLTSTGTGVPILQWEVDPSRTGAGVFIEVPTDSIYDAINSNKLFIETILEDTIISYDLSTQTSLYDTLINLDNFDFRIRSTTQLCVETTPPTYFYSDTVTLNVKPATLDECDFDLDGMNNLIDLDDDGDGLTDSVEVYISTSEDPEDFISQFNADTDNDTISDSEEDADGDTINNGEESDDDNGDGVSEFVDLFLDVAGALDDEDATPPTEEDELDIFNGDPLDPCDPILSPTCIGVVLDIKVKLHGALLDTLIEDDCDGCMRDDLRVKGLIPVDEPYDGMEINRLGNGTGDLAFEHVDHHRKTEPIGGTEVATPEMFENQLKKENDIVDWVFVELRSSIQLDSIIVTRSGLLQRDGDIRDVALRDDQGDTKFYDEDGYKYLSFDSTFAGEYYVSVRHRNHLGVMTNEAGLLSPKLTVVDFVDPNTNALGIHPQRMFTKNKKDDMGNDVKDADGVILQDSISQAMWAGDLNSDRRVIYQGARNDVEEMFINILRVDQNEEDLANFILPGYRRSDYNLDGNTIYQGPRNDRQMLIFNSILTFPDNQENFLANYVILEQLP